MFAKLIYSEKSFSINPPSGGLCASHVFSLNSLFDVDVTGVGHQPAGYDQLMAIYEQYTVIGVRYKVSLVNSDAAITVMHGVSVQDQVGATPDPRVYMENGQTQWKILGGKSEASDSISEFAGYISMPATHGKTYQEYISEDIYRGTASASPTEQAFLHIWAAEISTGDPGPVLGVIELEFNCLFQGTKLNALS